MSARIDWVIKLGGRGLIEPATLKLVASQIVRLKEFGLKIAVVHGGGPAINEELTSRGITWSFLNGQRVTTPEMMDVIEMVLCGSMNRKVVHALQAAGIDAVGFSGVDGRTFQCSQLDPELQQVGHIDEVRSKWIEAILGAGGVPVIAPIGGSSEGLAYNINADWAAARLAGALAATKLVFLTDQKGILNAKGEPISEMDETGLESLITDGVVTGGMLTKTNTILHALRSGVENVQVLHAQAGLWADAGTSCQLNFKHAKITAPEVSPWV